MLANGNHLIGKIVNLNHENSISENFLGEERNFPGFGPGMLPSPPSAARASFLSLILGNFVPHLENFRKYYISTVHEGKHYKNSSLSSKRSGKNALMPTIIIIK